MFEFIDVTFKDVLEIPTLVIREGMTVLLGASGSGKTTVLRLLNKMVSPTRGKILFRGEELAQIPSVEHRRRVMMLSQNPVIFDGTIGDNLKMAAKFQEKEEPGMERMEEVLTRVRLRKSPESTVDQLSGGEKQRLALARVFLCNPDIYLLDEPSSALDEDTETAIIQMIAEDLIRTGKSAVMVTHTRAVAETYADEILEMAEGKIIDRRSGRAGNH